MIDKFSRIFHKKENFKALKTFRTYIKEYFCTVVSFFIMNFHEFSKRWQQSIFNSEALKSHQEISLKIYSQALLFYAARPFPEWITFSVTFLFHLLHSFLKSDNYH